MSNPSGIRLASAALLIAAPLLSQAIPISAWAGPASPDSAPESEVSSGQRVTGYTRTHKEHSVKTSPEQPAPATAQKIPPSERLHTAPNMARDQVAPIPEAPVKPGSRPAPGADTPKPGKS